MKTDQNLMAAFAGESQANRKYLAFARKAEKEGFKNIGRFFQAIAEAETIHALKHLETAGKVGSTLENLTTAVDGEQYEFTEMYPGFIATAKEDGNERAAKSFEFANEAEKSHGKLFQALKEKAAAGSDAEDKAIHLCPVCGWVGAEPIPDRCPICGTASKMFKQY
jgi:rubrerythrin